MTAIFISHSSADNDSAAEMKHWLESQGHTSLFLDFDPEMGIKGGTEWEQTIYRQLRQCQAVIALLTPNWLASKWCFTELALARASDKAVFPVKIQPCETDGVFRDLQHIDLTVHREEGYEQLRIGLLDRGLDPLDVFNWDPKRPPFPGLLAFQEQDAAIFFGRGESVITTLKSLEKLRQPANEGARFALLLGASGSGKSSLVRAGIIPRLKKQHGEWLPIPPFRPQLEPFDELALALAAAFQACGQPHDWSALRAELHEAGQDPSSGQILVKLVRDLAIAARQPDATVLITIDQAEELFGYTSGEAAMRFLQVLRAGLETGDRRLMAVATLRSDFLGEFQNHPALQDSEYPHHFRYSTITLHAMPLKSFPEIIRGPARLAGLRLEDGLVEAMVEDTGTRYALPLLAFSLRRLYERFGCNGLLTLQEYTSQGRLEGAIQEEAERIIAESNPTQAELEALHAAFVPTLVRINAEGVYARSQAFIDDLPTTAIPLLRRFVDARLLVSARDDSKGRETLEVAHEALLRTWPQLSVWLTEDQDNLRLLESLRRAAEEWDQEGRRDDLLVHQNTRLKDLEGLVATPRFALPEGSLEQAYLITCRQAEENREAAKKLSQKRQLERELRDAERIAVEERKRANAEAKRLEEQIRASRKLKVSLAVLAFAVLWTVWLWQSAETARKKATGTRVLAEAQRVRSQSASGFPLSALLGIESYRHYPRDEFSVNQFLRESLGMLPKAFHALPHESPVRKIVFSPDGQRLATVSKDNTVRLWEVINGKELQVLKHDGRVFAVTFSPDGQLLATASADKTARLWDAATGKELQRLSHDGRLFAVTFSHDGHRLATGSEDMAARLWDVTTGIELQRLSHDKPVVWVSFSPDSHQLTTASRLSGFGNETTVRLWDVASGNETRRFSLEESEKYTTVSPDGQLLATASLDKKARLLDVASGKELQHFDHKEWLEGAAFSPDGRLFATASKGTVRLWDISSGKELHRFNHDERITALAFSPDGQRIVIASEGNTAWLREVATGKEIKLLNHGGDAKDVVFSPDGQRLAIASNKPPVQLWDVSEGMELHRLVHDDPVNTVAFSPNGQRLITYSGYFDSKKTVWLWDAALGRELLHISHDDLVSWGFVSGGQRMFTTTPKSKRIHIVQFWDTASGKELQHHCDDERINANALSPNGQQIALVSNGNTVSICDTASGKELYLINYHFKYPTKIDALAYSPDGQLLAIASRGDKTVRLWNTSSWKEIHILKFHKGIHALTFSPDGQQLAIAGSDNTVHLWNTVSGKELKPLSHEDTITKIYFSPDGKRLVTEQSDRERLQTIVDSAKSDVELAKQKDSVAQSAAREALAAAEESLRNENNTLRLWDLVAGRELQHLSSNKGYPDWVFSPDGKRLVISIDRHKTLMLDADSGKELNLLSHEIEITAREFSPDSLRLATTNFDGTVQLWDAATGKELQRLNHEKNVSTLAFSLDGQRLATASEDKAARVWDVTTGKELHRLTHDKYVSSVAFSHDGQWLATASHDKTARLWLLQPKDLTSELCGRLAKNLSWEEWQTYFAGEPYRKTCEFLPTAPDDQTLLRRLVASGRNDEATRMVNELNAADPLLHLSHHWLEALELLKEHRIADAATALYNAERIDGVVVTSQDWNELCREGALSLAAAQVIDSCEKAVTTAKIEEILGSRDSRGLARALSGNTQGAIVDFEYFIEKTRGDEAGKKRRQAWVQSLRAGQNPFTQDELKLLHTE